MAPYPLIVTLIVAACAKRPAQPLSEAEPMPTTEPDVAPEVTVEAAAEVLIRARPACEGEISVQLAGWCLEWWSSNQHRGAPERPAPVGVAPEGLRCGWFDLAHWTIWIDPGATGVIQCAVNGCISPRFRIAENVTSSEILDVWPYDRRVSEFWYQDRDAEFADVPVPTSIHMPRVPPGRTIIPCPE